MTEKRKGNERVTNESRDRVELTWEGADLPRVSAGNYQAICTGWQGPAWVRSFRRWCLRLEFQLLTEEVHVSGFYNFGNDPEKPRIGRKSRFYEAWCRANGETPKKGQRMGPETFTEGGLLFTLSVADAEKDEKDRIKPDATRYSRVTDILEVRQL